MDERDDDRILEEILAALEEGAEPDVAALRARHPLRAAHIEELALAARSYRQLALPKPVAPGELSPGTRVGDFEVERWLARGGMSEVYVARQLSLGRRPVALKLLAVELSGDEARARFEREALALASLHHPRLAEVYGFGEQHGRRFLAMRLVEGRSLKEVHEELARRAVDRSERGERRRLVSWIADVASALAAVHERGLVHRDVKPANVVLEGEAAMLVDFGLARPADGESLTLTGSTPATPDYASPEQALGHKVAAPSDVFSLGATLHDLLSGRLPHQRQRASAGLEPIEHLAKDVDRDLAALVAKAVDPVERWRYPHAGEFHADLVAWLEGRSVAARRRPWSERARRQFQEHPARVVRALAVALLFAFVVVAFARLGREAGVAAELREADAGGDVLRAWNAGRELAPWLRWPLLRDERLVALSRRAVESPAEDPIGAVANALDHERREDALQLAVTHLRVQGYGDEPLLVRFLQASLRRLPGESTSVPRALVLAARLFYERPVVERAEFADSEPVRAELWRLWKDPSVTGDARLYVLSALAGCGTAEMVRDVARWTSVPGIEEERVRLGWSAVARLVRRQYVAGVEEELDLDGIWEELLPLFRRLYADHGPVLDAWPTARDYQPMGQVIEELTNLERVQGRASRMLGFVPETWMPCLEEGGPDAYSVAALLAAARDPRVIPALEDGRLRRPEFGGSWGAWGNWTACMGDPQLLGRVRARCSELASEEADRALLLAHFETGVETVREQAQRTMGASDLDPDTLLGVRDAEAELEEIPLIDAGDDGNEDDAWGCVWDFNQVAPQREGSALGARARFASLDRGERKEPYLRLFDFGASELRLAFEVERRPDEQEVELRLLDMAAVRGRYPYGGVAYLDLSIDGASIAERLLVSRSTRLSVFEQRLLVPSFRLSPGRHELALRLHPETTTTYRLFRVEFGSYSGPIRRMSDR